MRVYQFKVLGRDQYKVMRVDNKKNGKDRYKEYLVDLQNGDMLCDCKSFYYTKKACKHIKFVISQLADGGGILDFEREGDYDRLLVIK